MNGAFFASALAGARVRAGANVSLHLARGVVVGIGARRDCDVLTQAAAWTAAMAGIGRWPAAVLCTMAVAAGGVSRSRNGLHRNFAEYYLVIAEPGQG